jgi:hypothetical protein
MLRRGWSPQDQPPSAVRRNSRHHRQMPLMPPSELTDLFAPFDSGDLELLASFVRGVDELHSSRFGRNLSGLGSPPVLSGVRRRLGGGGSGVIRVQHASTEARAAIFAVCRRLREEHEYASLHQACGRLRGSTKRKGTTAATELGYRIDGLRRRLRDAGSKPALVGAAVTDQAGKREYVTRKQVLELAEYGHHFHQDNADLRRDWLALPQPLLEPSVDEALRVAAEAALALYPLAAAVLEEPALRRR